MVSNLTSGSRSRIERANWYAFGLSKITSSKDVSGVKRWIRDNLVGDSYTKVIKETINDRHIAIATFVRVKDEADAILFKMAWAAYE